MERYRNSIDWLARAESVTPTGSQTFSKSKYSLPLGAAPLYLDRGLGSRVWDIDENVYVDLVSALLCISLGYQDGDVDAAVQAQIRKGVSFSLPHRLEAVVAEQIIDLIPCAEQVRFGKNGTDVTSAAIRLARAYTGREHVAVCGYHGWQDWYIGSTSRSLGVPGAVQELTHVFQYNNIDSLESLLTRFPQQIAAVILEPMAAIEPVAGFLQAVRQCCDQHGVVLIFDEMITGFRFHLGGAQTLFGVTPDLATFGKGLANGYPLSALAGRRELMRVMEDIFYSGTFGGETLSLAAAQAVLVKMREQNVPTVLANKGSFLCEQVSALAKKHHCDHWFSLVGHPSWKLMQIRGDWCEGDGERNALLLKSLLIQELAREGVLTIGSHNVNYALGEEDMAQMISAYEKTFAKIGSDMSYSRIQHLLQGQPIMPVFKVRQ